MATTKGVLTALAHLSAAYRAEVDKAQVTVWTHATQSVEDDILLDATETWIRNGDRFPSPAQVLAIVRAIQRRREVGSGLVLVPEKPDPVRTLEMARAGVSDARQALRAALKQAVPRVDDVLGASS